MSAPSADSSSTSDSRGHLPEGKWAFDGAVTDCFDDMLARSIPQYDIMRAAVTALAKRHIQPKTAVVDLGSSRGEALDPLIKEFGAYNRWVAVEVSEPMLAVLRERFKGWIDSGYMDVLNMDLRQEFPPVTASVILSVLTLQFIPIEHRQGVIRAAYQHLTAGGALLLVEKVLGNTADLDDAFVEEYLGLKAANGYTEEEIQRKRLSLEGVLVPLTAEWNEDLLRRCGFQQVDCFWRWMNFAGWVAVK